MEEFRGPGFSSAGSTVRKKRSITSRRPRSDSQPFPDSRDLSLPSSTPPSDNVSKVSSDENTGYDTSSRRKEFSLNECASRASSINRVEGESAHKMTRKDYGAFGGSDGFFRNGGLRGSSEKVRIGSDFKRRSEGVLSPANWKSANKVNENFDLRSGKPDGHMDCGKNVESWNSGNTGVVSDGLGNDNKLRKVKLKVGGVTRTIHAKSSADGSSGGGSSIKSSRSSDPPRPRPKLILQDNSDDDQSPPPDKASGLQGVPWKDFSRGSFSLGKDNSSRAKMSEESVFGKQTDKSGPVRKSKRVPKRRILDGDLNDGNEDEEIRYLERLKTSKVTVDYGAEYEDDEDEGSKKQRKISRVSKSRMANGEYDDLEYRSSKLGRDGKKSRRERLTEDTDYVEEEEAASDGEPEEVKRKKQKKESVDLLMDGRKEMTLTTRQRALHSGKDNSTGVSASLIEFPNGLPPAPPRKQKEKLSEVEQQLKKAEAAQRRRMQVEKAARESEAEAIRKILGQDSNRKKREDKLKKRRDELAQEKAANAMTLASNMVRWVMGPNGTTVIFPKDVALPSIFDPKPSGYPPPREKCAGPSCTNPYKYRDSKSKLPLCSLKCYKAVNK